jgi:hypothetical protein
MRSTAKGEASARHKIALQSTITRLRCSLLDQNRPLSDRCERKHAPPKPEHFPGFILFCPFLREGANVAGSGFSAEESPVVGCFRVTSKDPYVWLCLQGGLRDCFVRARAEELCRRNLAPRFGWYAASVVRCCVRPAFVCVCVCVRNGV